ncbi:MAG TPA: dUTP diphosphatase [Candidatus Polarisedimenticolaceae bacterium]|nr:dUTP diphosphatase [Candidatus Polarisedimenticolaceae bacterium]
MTSLVLKVKRFDSDLPLPERKTAGAAAYDLCARKDTKIPGGGFGLVPLNVAIELPAGHWGLLAVRSSLHKQGLMPANGIGVIDHDYQGDDDEYHAALYNTSAAPVMVTRGMRVAQLVVVGSAPDITVTEVDSLENTSRGGFGSTGTH